MRKQIKLAALVAATGLVAASVQAASYNGDLIVGFTSGSGTDFVYDLGSASTALVNLNSWDLSSYLGSFNLATVNWGVIGDSTSTHNVWSTTDGSYAPRDVAGHGDLINNIEDPTESIYANFSTAGAGSSASISYDPSVPSSSWYSETYSPSLGNDYANSYNNPNVSGEVSDTIYLMPGYNQDPQVQGYFSLASDGVLTFDAVPEPSTIGLLTGAGLLLVVLRNKFRRNQLT